MADLLSDTLKRSEEDDPSTSEPGQEPGIVLIFTGKQPLLQPMALPEGATELGRVTPELGQALGSDPLISRRHAQCVRKGATVQLIDLASRNGSHVDGEPIAANTPRVVRRYFRLGDSLFLLTPDIRPFRKPGLLSTDGSILGPTMQSVMSSIQRAALHGDVLHITGESGSGKELCARAFHDGRGGDRKNFVAVNCATIPESIAERLLFGAKRGAFSGADADADGYVQSADGGTLFLDEIVELHPTVQAKLLRVLENREVLAVGAARPRPVKLHICSATHQDLRAQVIAGRLREDLYFRIGKPSVLVPPLRERLEEIPWLVQRTAQQHDRELTVSAAFIEQCLGRMWPGNVRELLLEVRAAIQTALSQVGRTLEARHLSRSAGSDFGVRVPQKATDKEVAAALERSRIESALEQTQGNVSAAARLLGIHRTQLYRWMSRSRPESDDETPNRRSR